MLTDTHLFEYTHIDRQTDKQTDTDRDKHRQTDRQTDKHTPAVLSSLNTTSALKISEIYS